MKFLISKGLYYAIIVIRFYINIQKGESTDKVWPRARRFHMGPSIEDIYSSLTRAEYYNIKTKS